MQHASPEGRENASEVLASLTGKSRVQSARWLEELAAAYTRKTGLDPREAELCHRIRPRSDGGVELSWWFQLKPQGRRR